MNIKLSYCLAVANKPPVWINANTNYVFIPRSSPAGASVFNISASDDATKMLTYSVLGVQYMRDETSTPTNLYKDNWGVNSSTRVRPNTTNCKFAESLPFPRNLFCIEYFSNTIKTTGMFSTSQPLMSSLFVLDILISDGDTTPLNVSGKVFVRIARNCTLQTSFLAKVEQGCLSDVGLLKSFGSISGDKISLATKFPLNAINVRLGKMLIDFSACQPFKHTGKMVTFKITNSTTKAVIMQLNKRLLIDPAKEPYLVVDLHPSPVLNGSFTLTVESGGSSLAAARGADFPAIQIYTLPARSNCFYGSCRKSYSSLREILSRANALECTQYETKVLFDAKFGSCGVGELHLTIIH